MTACFRRNDHDADVRLASEIDHLPMVSHATKLAIYAEIAAEEGREEFLGAYIDRAIKAGIL